MNNFNFSSEGLGKAVPSFATPDDNVFDRVLPFIEAAYGNISDLLAEWSDEWPERIRRRIERLSYIGGCRRAIPHLDLVLTPFGFGVVSNQNHAPASAHRVEALQEELRRDESQTHDGLFQDLLLTTWATTSAARRMVSSLLWNATILRIHGVTYQGAEVYEKEFNLLKPAIQKARLAAERIISSDLMAALVRRIRFPMELEHDLYAQLSDSVTHYMASVIMHRQGHLVPMLEEAEDSLLQFVRSNKHRLPEYADSATCAAHDDEPYQNQKDHGTYFF